MVLEAAVDLVEGQAFAQEPDHQPGSTVPLRVAITSPSSGVKPIVVSTETPPATAHSDAPAPRWQVTVASDSTGRSSSVAARFDAH